MSCDWREQVDLYVDGELEPASQQAFSGHVQGCSDCATAVLEQLELKKAVRLAGKRFTAPPDLYASVRRQIHPEARATRGWSWGLVSAALILFIALGFGWYARSHSENATLAELVDLHVNMLASPNPVDVISSDKHTVKPWYQGKLPFTFNFPNPAANSPLTLIGGKVVYVQHSPGAELVYQVRLHKISVFVFQARDVSDAGSAYGSAFTVNSWQQNGLQYSVVTDASKEDAEQLRALLEEANRQ